MPALSKMVGFVITNNAEEAKKFYGETLGFRLINDDGFALVFDANGTMIRVGKGKTSSRHNRRCWGGKWTTSMPRSENCAVAA